MEVKLPCEYIDPTLAVQALDVVCDSNNKYSWESKRPGIWRLSSAKDLSFYGISVWKNAGHWSIFNGEGRILSKQPSAFTGSFVFQGHAAGGLIIRLGAGVDVVPTLFVAWVELNA